LGIDREKEGKAEEELVDQFLCYDKTGKGSLETSIADSEAAIPQLESTIEELIAKNGQLVNVIAQAKTAREDAKQSIMEVAAFAKSSADASTNVAGLKKAITALEKGA
jgi:phage shock protein A